MGDRNLLRDKTLVLRILVPSLETALRDKMEEANLAFAESHAAAGSSYSTHSTSPPLAPKDGQCLDLEGVTCEPSIQSTSSSEDATTLWEFHCDGATYPARLINLPCPVELHKTHDRAMYYKCVDVAQMLVVYEDMSALEEAESAPGYQVDGFPSYFHSGLTPPMARVVERRFAARSHKAVAPTVREVRDVERELMDLIDKFGKESAVKKTKGGGASSGTTHSNITGSSKVVTETFDEVVDYEPWMDNHGRSPKGVEFSEGDDLCIWHPEVWLSPEDDFDDEPVSSASVSASSKNRLDSPASSTSTKKTKKSSHNHPRSHTQSPSISSGRGVTPTADMASAHSTSSTSKTDRKDPTEKKKSKKKKNRDLLVLPTTPTPPDAAAPPTNVLPDKDQTQAQAQAQQMDEITQNTTEMFKKNIEELVDDYDFDEFGFDFDGEF